MAITKYYNPNSEVDDEDLEFTIISSYFNLNPSIFKIITFKKTSGESYNLNITVKFAFIHTDRCLITKKTP
jgi:hypothetical protein